MTGVRDRDQPGNDAGDPSPSDELPRLDTQQLDVLRQVGCHWARAVGDRESWRQALPVDAGLVRYPSELQPGRFGRFVRLDVQGGRPSQAAAVEEPEADRSGFARLGALAHRLILGPPLKSTAIVQERMRKLIRCSHQMCCPRSLTGRRRSCHRQTIRAYSHGGGSYIVASENLGATAGLLAAAGLMIDYVMTVAVSIAAELRDSNTWSPWPTSGECRLLGASSPWLALASPARPGAIDDGVFKNLQAPPSKSCSCADARAV
ncbi:MAG: hypothetical protein ACR2MK_00355 [Solirubrobacteraceae bacterium]